MDERVLLLPLGLGNGFAGQSFFIIMPGQIITQNREPRHSRNQQGVVGSGACKAFFENLAGTISHFQIIVQPLIFNYKDKNLNLIDLWAVAVHHILLVRPKWRNHRQRYLTQLRTSDVRQLLNTPKGSKAVVQYILATDILPQFQRITCGEQDK